MSCHVTLARFTDADRIGAFESAGPYLDLVSAGRKDDFRWLALSQGVSAERIEELWQRLRSLHRRSSAR